MVKSDDDGEGMGVGRRRGHESAVTAEKLSVVVRSQKSPYAYYVLHRYTIEHIVREREGAPR